MGSTSDRIRLVEAELGFTRAIDVSRDADERGVLRARTLDLVDARSEQVCDMRTCAIRDCAELDDFRPDIVRNGFDVADLSGRAVAQQAFERIRRSGRAEEADAVAIRRDLVGARLRLRGGRGMRILYIAPEGFIVRRGGPNGMALSRSGTLRGMNDHGAAVNVHADQDVFGTPVRQILRGAAPWLFHHDSPDGSNARSPLFLLNLWVPLQQITRPLALMDKRTLDRRSHQLRYALPTDAFLERDEERRVNDIWTFLPDAAQRWYFTSQMDARQAYVFETLSTPHGAFVLPGEECAEARHRALEAAATAVRAGDAAALARASAPDARGAAPLDSSPYPLRAAIAVMDRLLDEAHRAASAEHDLDRLAGWVDRALSAMNRVVRCSLEMRVVAVVTGRAGG